MRRGWRIGVALLLAAAPAGARAQNANARLTASRDSLARIRREREELQQKMQALQSRAHTLADEVRNIDSQHEATHRAVKTLDDQLVFIGDAVKETSTSLVRAEDEAATKRAILRHRVIDIYKRGPMYDFEALLSAQSFGELLARYKYLHELALRDRALVHRVEALRQTIRDRRNHLVTLQGDVRENRYQKQQEEQRLKELEAKQQRTLARVQEDAKRTERRLRELAQAERRVNNLIASFEAARRSGSRRASTVARGASSVKTSDYGKLPWPVDGNILYGFGRVVNPNNTVTRWNGIGIAAATGTPVRVVSGGEVRVAERVGTYGLTVIVEHGGGDYTTYSHLGSTSVSAGAKVAKGEVIGTVGPGDSDLPSHLHFEVRQGGMAIDPTEWLRRAR